jgi:hypothetical protein
MNQVERIEPVKRPVGRPKSGRPPMPVVFSCVTPEIAEALARESERRGVKTSTVIREALETVFKPMINRAA